MKPFADRRHRLLDRINGVMVCPAAPITIRNNDVEHEYRQNSDLYYLTGFTEPECVLVLAKAHPKHKVVLFVRPRDADREAWDGPRLGVDGAIAELGADAAYPIEELDRVLPEFLAGNRRLYYALGYDRDFDARVLGAVAHLRGRGRARHVWPTEIVDPALLLHEMRLRKDDDEIVLMRRAAEITRDAHLGAMSLAAPGRFEYELDAVIRQVFRQSGSERPAYGPIVGSGPNATVLHYRKNARCLEDGELVLVDAGCEYGYYASDVTRTFSVSGAFSRPQRALYEVVLEAQQAAIEAVSPGVTLDSIHDLCLRRLVAGLIRLGLLHGEPDSLIEKQTYKPYFMHRTSHWLGMDVHDVGNYYVSGQSRLFEPGMVITVEPGIYVQPNEASAPAEYRGLGIRIEDDVLVTPTGHRELTDDIPKTVSDVEEACRA